MQLQNHPKLNSNAFASHMLKLLVFSYKLISLTCNVPALHVMIFQITY